MIWSIDATFLLYSANAFAFSIVALAVSYLCGIILKGSNVMTLASTVVSLAFAFLGGVFVPQEVLTEGVLKIAQFIPSYWYVLANDGIARITNFTWQNISEVINFMLIQLAIATVIFIITYVYSFARRKQEG